MQTYHISKSFSYRPTLTERVRSVMRMFGLDVQRLRQGGRRHECTLKLAAGDICYITGASGAGKSVLLSELYGQMPPNQRLRLGDIPIESYKSLVDCIEGAVNIQMVFLDIIYDGEMGRQVKKRTIKLARFGHQVL